MKASWGSSDGENESPDIQIHDILLEQGYEVKSLAEVAYKVV